MFWPFFCFSQKADLWKCPDFVLFGHTHRCTMAGTVFSVSTDCLSCKWYFSLSNEAATADTRLDSTIWADSVAADTIFPTLSGLYGSRTTVIET